MDTFSGPNVLWGTAIAWMGWRVKAVDWYPGCGMTTPCGPCIRFCGRPLPEYPNPLVLLRDAQKVEGKPSLSENDERIAQRRFLWGHRGRELEAVTEHDLAMNFLKDTWWVATARRIHFMDTKFRPPWCLQRQGNRAKPLSRVLQQAPKLRLQPCLA